MDDFSILILFCGPKRANVAIMVCMQEQRRVQTSILQLLGLSCVSIEKACCTAKAVYLTGVYLT